MKNLACTVPTAKSFDEAVAAVEQSTAAHGFRVLHVHDMAGILAEKGFPREPLKIVEICNAKYSSDLLQKEVTAALMLPCPIVVYQQDGQTQGSLKMWRVAQVSTTTNLGAPGLAFETWEGCEPHHRLSSSRLHILARMTRGLHRYQQSGNFHFITFSCYQRRPYLGRASARNLFESALERIRKRYHFVVLGHVIMPEHVHLLVSEPKKGTLDRAIQALKLSVSVRSRHRPFWQPRYYDFNVWNPEKTAEKLRYMHRNPVKRGLVSKPEDWAWSSFRHYATGFEGTVEIESFWTASRRGNQIPNSQVSESRPGAPNSHPVPL